MSDWFQRMVRQVQINAPRCLAGFELSPVHQLDCWEERTSWQLFCPCGANTGQVLGYSLKDFSPDYDGPEMFVSPLAFQCVACAKVTEIIDTGVHGYDGECGHPATIRGEGTRKAFACIRCGATAFTVTAGCSYPHFDLIEDEPDLEPRSQDFFDCFGCLGVCTVCGTESAIANYELA